MNVRAKVTLKIVFGLICLLLLSIIWLGDGYADGNLEIIKETYPGEGTIQLTVGEPAKFWARATRGGYSYALKKPNELVFSAEGNPTLADSKSHPLLLAHPTQPTQGGHGATCRPTYYLLGICFKIDHWVEYSWSTPGNYVVTATLFYGNSKVTEQWSVNVRNDAAITQLPLSSRVNLNTHPWQQKFRIEASTPNTEPTFDYIEFSAEGIEGKDRNTCHVGCREVADDKIYRQADWSENGVYKVTAKIVTTPSKSGTITIYSREWWVKVGNRDPVWKGSPPNLTVNMNEQVAIPLSDYSYDPDNSKVEFDHLTYQIILSDSSVAEVKQAGDDLVIRPKKVGSTTVSVKVKDESGAETSQKSFTVSVKQSNLIVESIWVTARDSNTSITQLAPNQKITLHARIKNTGDDWSEGTELVQYFRQGISKRLKARYITNNGQLGPNTTTVKTYDTVAPSNTGTYTYYANVISSDNDTTPQGGKSIDVTVKKAATSDLAITTWLTERDQNARITGPVAPRYPLSIRASVKYNGDVPTPKMSLYYYYKPPVLRTISKWIMTRR